MSLITLLLESSSFDLLDRILSILFALVILIKNDYGVILVGIDDAINLTLKLVNQIETLFRKLRTYKELYPIGTRIGTLYGL